MTIFEYIQSNILRASGVGQKQNIKWFLVEKDENCFSMNLISKGYQYKIYSQDTERTSRIIHESERQIQLLPMQGTWVWPLVQDDFTGCGAPKLVHHDQADMS